jgi:hypothetical protein
MLELMGTLGILGDDVGPDVQLRRIKGRIVTRPRSGPPQIAAEGRDDWIGWAELRTEPVDELAIQHTAQTIAAARPDILAFVEVESRPTLLEFHDRLIRPVADAPFDSLMLIDGNDPRGIDVGLALRAGWRIWGMQSHVDDRGPDGSLVFSRDCPEYVVTGPGDALLAVLPNHFKSKFGGDDARSRARRRAQAEAAAGIYLRLRAEGMENVVLLGDLNDTPDSEALAPLFATDLREVATHPAFTEFQFRARTRDRGIGTFGTGADRDKIDHILLSPALWDRMQAGGLERRGVWTASGRWDMFPTLTAEVHGASDHHLIWADLAL